jgi:hypothetical protein
MPALFPFQCAPPDSLAQALGYALQPQKDREQTAMQHRFFPACQELAYSSAARYPQCICIPGAGLPNPTPRSVPQIYRPANAALVARLIPDHTTWRYGLD